MANWNRERRSIEHEGRSIGFRGEDATQTGFYQNYQSFLAATIQSDLTISRFIMDAPKRERNDIINDLIAKNKIPSDIVEANSKSHTFSPAKSLNYAALSEYVVSEGIADVQTDDQINENIQYEIQNIDSMSRDVGSRAGLLGKIGGFAGGMHAGALDPVGAAVSLAIPAMGHSATIWKSIARQASGGFTAGAAAEVVMQPIITQYKNEVGLDYSFSDALTNGVASAILGGTIGGVTGGASGWVKQSRDRAKAAREIGDNRSAEAAEVAGDVAEQLDIESRNAPDPEAHPFDHDRQVVDSGKDIDNHVNNPPPQEAVEPANAEEITNDLLARQQEILDEAEVNNTSNIIDEVDDGSAYLADRMAEINRPADDPVLIERSTPSWASRARDDGTERHEYDIMDGDRNVGSVFVSIMDEGKTIRIDDITSPAGPGQIKPSGIRKLLRQLRDQFPEATKISGERVSGMRHRGEYVGEGKGDEVEIPLRPDRPVDSIAEDIEEAGSVVDIVGKADGSSFKTKAAASAQRTKRGLDDYVPVEVEEGYWLLYKYGEATPPPAESSTPTPPAESSTPTPPAREDGATGYPDNLPRSQLESEYDRDILDLPDEDGVTLRQALRQMEYDEQKLALATTCVKGA